MGPEALAAASPLMSLDVGQPFIVELDAPAENRDPARRENATLTASLDSGRVDILLTETMPDSGVFAGAIMPPGRMAETGIGFFGVVGPALAALGLGGVLGGLASTWWTQRQGDAEARHPEPLAEPPVTRPVTEVPPVAPEPFGPADLSTEETVRVERPPAR